jgi:uncharacterized protein YukE
MAVQVLVGPNAQADAAAFVAAVQQFTQEVARIQAAGSKLANTAEWQGQAATQFDNDYQQFVRQVQLMDQSLTKMSQGAKTVITNIDTADTAGAGTIGTFTG